jgi:hypothetical protein
MKDRFSSDSKGYATFRPGYPAELLQFILDHTPGRTLAWDCATGNGQFASLLAPPFAQVYATDMSANQIAQALPSPNIHYSQQPAESTNFPDHAFDLITVAQAIHWFDFERFYAEVRRVAAPNAMLAVIGYPLLSVNADVDSVLHHFYHETLQDHWDQERRYLDADYRTIPFPFQEVAAPKFYSTYDWNFDQFIGYLNTWSAVKNYIAKEGNNPLVHAETNFQTAWREGESHQVTFPMILKLGHVELGHVERSRDI